MHPPRRLAVTASLALLLASSLARAAPEGEPPTPASEWLRRGVELRRQRRDAEALDAFRAAAAIAPTPEARAQIGLAAYALGRWVEAERELASASERADDAWIIAHAEGLARALAVVRGHVGRLEVATQPEGAEVRVDGEVVARGAGPLVVEAGGHLVEATTPEGARVSTTMDVPGGGVARAVLTLRAAGTLAPPAPAAPTMAPRLAADAPRRVPVATVGWITVGVGGLIALAGGGLHLRRDALARDYNAECPRGRASDACAAQRDDVDAWGTAAVAAYAAGASLIVAGAALVVVRGAGRDGPRVAIRATPGGMAIGMGGAF